MLLHIGFHAVGRVIRRRCSLFLQHRFIPILTVTRRNVESVNNKEMKVKTKSILEKVIIKESQTTAEKGIALRILIEIIQTSIDEFSGGSPIVKEKATNAYLYVAYVVSMLVVGGMTYLLYEEMFSPGAPQRVFSKALSLIKKDPECHRLLGDSIMGYVEGRGRMKQVVHHVYKKDGNDRTRIMFNVKGTRREGIATCEMEKSDGTWKWRFLIVSSADPVPEYVILIDSR